MSEWEFWHSNPAKIKTYEEAWKMQENRRNELIHAWVGNYGVSALVYAVEHCLNGKKATSKYMDKPMQLFELTEEEKKQAQKNALAAFVAWADGTKETFDKKHK